MSDKCELDPARIEAMCPPDLLSYSISQGTGARGVIIADAENRIQFIDPGICDLLDVRISDLMGKDARDAVRDVLKHRSSDPDGFERLRGKTEGVVEDVIELASPEHRVLHRYSTPLLGDKRQPLGRIEVYSDITRRRRLEDANRSLYKQVCAAYEELRATQEQLVQSEKLRAVVEIASGVAHDFNNTLGIILGNIHLLLRTAYDPKTRARLESVEQAAFDATETVRRIREFTKVQPEEPRITIDLSALARGLIEVMSPSWESIMQAQDRRLELALDLADGAFAVGTAAEVREVLANILLNAVQAMPQGGKIRVSTGRSDSSAWVKVTDTGVGMSEEVRSRIFDPFFTTKGVEGTGLGMSVAYGIVKRHEGRISVESAPGLGTAITVHLPVSIPEIPPEAADTIDSPAPVSARILVVDDEARFADVFTEMLSEHGHMVCVARSGQEAIKEFMAAPFDLVFTDLGMPGMSGWQVAQTIKTAQPNTPVVLLTGWGNSVDESRLAESKIDLVVSKPVRMGEISEIVSRALSGVSLTPEVCT
ncbi:MAG: hybrid sensor histidine kinase/response regulator [Armatimonadota bacterium]